MNLLKQMFTSLSDLWKDERGAVTVAAYWNSGAYYEAYNVTASATADAAATIAHGLGVSPDTAPGMILFTPLLAAAYHSQWRVQQTLTTANTLSLVKTSTASSSGNTPQLRVSILRPHTIMQ